MSDPVDYLSEETYRPEWLKDGVTEHTLKAMVRQRPALARLGGGLAKYNRFYMVGSGGSYGVQLPLEYLAEKYTKVPVHTYSGWEFLEQQPEAVDGDAACIFISQSGRTKEIVRALEWCRERGAVTVGLTQKTESVINEKADHGIGWEGRGVTLGKLGCLYTLFGTIFREKGYDVGSMM